jgi:hypothetical protein
VSVATRTYEGGSKTKEGELIVCFLSSFGKKRTRVFRKFVLGGVSAHLWYRARVWR